MGEKNAENDVKEDGKKKLMVLCVDRDNDLGRKTRLKSPIIGRENNINAAQKLALADPEESDANSIFGAVNVYDEITKKGMDVEVATICGSQNVGFESDMIIAEQLEDILEKTGASKVLLVSDGADDEFVSPIIGSRVKIEGVRRIIVRQSQDLESTYYTMIRALEDPRFQRMFLIPIAMILLIVGISLVTGYPQYGLASIFIVLACYIFIRVMGWEYRIERVAKGLYLGFVTGKVSLIMYILAAFVLIVGAATGFDKNFVEISKGEGLQQVFLFIIHMVWYGVLATVLISMGKILDSYLSGEMFSSQYLIISISAIAVGLILQGIVGMLVSMLRNAFTAESILFIVLGIFVAIIGAALHGVLKGKDQATQST